MIKSRNIDPTAEFAQSLVALPLAFTASVTTIVHCGPMPWAGKIVKGSFRSGNVFVHASGATRVKILKNGVDITAAVNPGAVADATTPFTLTDDTFVAGDVLKGSIVSGAGDSGVGTFAFVIRPLLGGVERRGLAG